MRAYLDTEFTDLTIQPRLLSVGVVTEARVGREFYAEVSDADRIRATGWFGLCAVLPQFGKVADAACTYAEVGARLSAFLKTLTADLKADEFVDLACVDGIDWGLVDLAVVNSGAEGWASTRRRIRPGIVDELTGFGADAIAAEAHAEDQAAGRIARHHALRDARALRTACEMPVWSMAGQRVSLGALDACGGPNTRVHIEAGQRRPVGT